MIGVFDSGDGGLLAVKKIRAISESVDIVFLADRKNSPYGTKEKSEIINIPKENLQSLINFGSDTILIACCTASSIYSELSDEEKRISVPIIDATAIAALMQTRLNKIGVIATRATVLSGAFTKSIKAQSPSAKVFEYETQQLVSLVESGVSDDTITPSAYSKIKEILKPLKNIDFDVLILGCTHFPWLQNTISEIVGCKTVSSTLFGAIEVLARHGDKGSKKTIFL